MSIAGDKKLAALRAADDAWAKALYASKPEKLGLAAELHRHELFSLPQIAKIVRLNARYVYDELTPNAAKGGGRFDPATLSTLYRIRQARVLEQAVPPALIRVAIKGGTSYSCLVKLTDIPYATYHKMSVQTQEQLDAAPEKNMRWAPKMTPEIEAEMRKMRRQHFTYQTIADSVGLGVRTVQRFFTAERESA